MHSSPSGRPSSILSRAIAGGLAGLLATGPMTMLMVFGHRRLPGTQRDPLPPAHITGQLLKAAAAQRELPAKGFAALTMVNHFGYGAAMGSLYGMVAAAKPPGGPFAAGALFGMGVWSGSYLGALPALDLYPPPTKDGASRNRLMIAAHLVWGSCLGVLAVTLLTERSREPPGEADASERLAAPEVTPQSAPQSAPGR
jgi:uncharacterized membrane protein YagU involved in acid resistance